MGRPRNPDNVDTRVQVRMRSLDERRAVEDAAEQAGQTTSQWLRELALRELGLPTEEPPQAAAARAMRGGRT